MNLFKTLVKISILTFTLARLCAMVSMRKANDVYTTISAGRVRGYSVSVTPHRTVNIFKKIPYALPPVGDLRFRRLRPVHPWNDTLDATEYGPACMSNSSMTSTRRDNIDEDCIYMNIFADAKCSANNGAATCPILVLIYSGAFAFGSATEYDESQIAEKYASQGIIFIIPAYRIGIFGFIDADEVAPNNVGLDDIIQGLKWIHDEIHHFGGDANRITIMGHSSGASVVQFLIASPALPPHAFRNAIAVSAVPVMAPRINWRQTRLLLHDLGCTNITTSNEAYLALSDRWWHASSPPGVPRTTAAELDCLRARPGLDLLRYQRNNEAVIRQVAYFCESSAQLPAVDFAQLLRKNIKPKSLLIFAVRDEMPSVDVHVREQCREQAAVFGYHSREFFEACRRRYTRKQSRLVERVVDGEPIADRAFGGISAESCHANAVQTAAANRWAGGDSYRAAFWMRNYTFHVSDAFFFIGFHRSASRELNSAERRMDDYYPRMIRSFVRNGRPHDRSWRPSDAEGRGFQLLDFVVADNGTLIKRPEFHSGYDDPSAVRFWLRDGKRIEEIAKRKRGRKEFKRFESPLLFPALTVLSSNFSGSSAPIDHVTVDSTDTVGVSSFIMLILATLFAWLSIFILVIVPFWWAFERWRNTRRRYRRWLDGEHDEYTPIKNADL